MLNPYLQLLALLPARPLLIGDVILTDGQVATVQLPGGGVLQARGDAAFGARVFVRDGVIEGTAPTMPIVTVEV